MIICEFQVVQQRERQFVTFVHMVPVYPTAVACVFSESKTYINLGREKPSWVFEVCGIIEYVRVPVKTWRIAVIGYNGIGTEEAGRVRIVPPSTEKEQSAVRVSSPPLAR